MTTRRKVLALIGVGSVSAPLAAKAAADASLGSLTGMIPGGALGFGNGGSLSLPGGSGAPIASEGPFVPYEKRLIRASDFIRLTGLPEVVENQIRDNSRQVFQLDPDIASKRSWSMNVKIAEQRQRNYTRSVERIHQAAWSQRKLSAIKALLGFEWPW
jgi:hypothetical protein